MTTEGFAAEVAAGAVEAKALVRQHGLVAEKAVRCWAAVYPAMLAYGVGHRETKEKLQLQIALQTRLLPEGSMMCWSASFLIPGIWSSRCTTSLQSSGMKPQSKDVNSRAHQFEAVFCFSGCDLQLAHLQHQWSHSGVLRAALHGGMLR